MTSNAYSNASGFTQIPWQYSIHWFKQLVISEAEQIEANLNGANTYTTSASVDMVGGVCFKCGTAIVVERDDCRVCGHNFETGRPAPEWQFVLTQDDIDALDTEPSNLGFVNRQELANLHNLTVELLRSACLKLNGSGAETIQVREGLVVTREWDAHFMNLSAAQPQLLLWFAVKHSMLGNPLAGEILEWKNSGSYQTLKPSSGAKLAGAAAVGLLAGFLFG